MAEKISTIENLFENVSLSASDIIEMIGHGILITDLEANILFWNEGCEQIFGYTRDEVLHKNAEILYPESRRDEIQEDLEQLKNGHAIEGTWPGLHKNGSITWVDTKTSLLYNTQGEPMAVLVSTCNIQKQKELEANLEESQARAKAILNNTVEAIITINTRGIIEGFNKAAEQIFGYEREEIIGKNVNKLMPEPHKKKHDDYISNYLETGNKKIIGKGREVQGKRKDGTVFPIELSVSEVIWNNNKIFSGIIRDISKRRKLENKLIDISEDERRRIGQELHDGLGQMLTGIGLISQNIAKRLEANGLPGASEVQEVSDMIKEADEYARSLSHGLVPLEVDEEGLRDAFKQLSRRAEKLFRIECIFEEKGNINVRKNNMALHLYRIAQEAINNAVKHGKADIIKMQLFGNEDSINFIIKDNGAGFNGSLQKAKKEGLGIHTMQYRTHILGGQFELNKSDDGWTQVVCKIPYQN